MFLFFGFSFSSVNTHAEDVSVNYFFEDLKDYCSAYGVVVTYLTYNRIDDLGYWDNYFPDESLSDYDGEELYPVPMVLNEAGEMIMPEEPEFLFAKCGLLPALDS